LKAEGGNNMAETEVTEHKFSRSRRWLLRLNLLIAILALASLVVMANYLAGGYFKRFNVDANSMTQLSPQTLRVLETLTNEVVITIFFDVENEKELYSMSANLLNEYQIANPQHITVKTLDYTRYDGQARALLARHSLAGLKDHNFILFECNGHSKIIYPKSLADYNLNAYISGESDTIRRSSFRGEMLFTSAIFSVCNPRPLKAYFLSGHKEHTEEAASYGEGYSKFTSILTDELDTKWQSLTLVGTNDIPEDCQVLIIAGPRMRYSTSEITKVDDYLKKGGRMLLLFNNDYNSGMEQIMSNWGASVENEQVREKDKDYVITEDGDFLTAQEAPHPIINALLTEKAPGAMIRLFSPRPFRVNSTNTPPGAPTITVVAASSTNSLCGKRKGAFPLIVAVEQGIIKNVNTPRGGTRIVSVGDSYLFCDAAIDSGYGNHAFAALTLNWLMERDDILLGGLVPRPIKEYRLLMTQSQKTSIQLLFLVGLPGVVLLVGGLVYLQRRR